MRILIALLLTLSLLPGSAGQPASAAVGIVDHTWTVGGTGTCTEEVPVAVTIDLVTGRGTVETTPGVSGVSCQGVLEIYGPGDCRVVDEAGTIECHGGDNLFFSNLTLRPDGGFFMSFTQPYMEHILVGTLARA